MFKGQEKFKIAQIKIWKGEKFLSGIQFFYLLKNKTTLPGNAVVKNEKDPHEIFNIDDDDYLNCIAGELN